MIGRWFRNSWFGHLLGLHSPSAWLKGECWCQRHGKRGIKG